MSSRAALLAVAGVAAFAWLHRRELSLDASLKAQLEDLAGLGPDAGELLLLTYDPNVRAFLAVIRHGETADGPHAYKMMFGGELFAHYADHPRIAVTRPMRINGTVQPITSTAAGAYQFLARTWDEVRAALKLPDFSPSSQDIGAVYLVRRRGALADVRAGRFDGAIAKCGREWASLPGSPYGQPRKSLEHVRAVYVQHGGAFA